MYLMGVKPWESANWVVPSIEEMSGKMREQLEALNPELALKKEAAPGGEGGVLENAEKEEHSDVTGEGSEGATRQRKELEA